MTISSLICRGTGCSFRLVSVGRGTRMNSSCHVYKWKCLKHEMNVLVLAHNCVGTPHRAHCNTPQHTATHCNILQHIAKHRITLTHKHAHVHVLTYSRTCVITHVRARTHARMHARTHACMQAKFRKHGHIPWARGQEARGGEKQSSLMICPILGFETTLCGTHICDTHQ